MRWCTTKWILDHRRKKRGRGYNTSSPIPLLILLISSLTRKLHFLDKIRHIFLSKKLDYEYTETNCRSNVVTLYILYTPTVYRRIQNFFKQARNSHFWLLVFFKWLFLWVRQSLMSLNIRIEFQFCVYYFLCLLARNAMCTQVYVPPNRAGMRDALMYPGVAFTVFKTVFFVMFMLGIKLI